MHRKLCFLICVSIVLVQSEAEPETEKSYRGYKVYRLKLQSNQTLEAFDQLYETGSFDFWKEPTLLGATDLMVSPDQSPQIDKLIESYKIPHEVMYQNLHQAIKAERRNSLNKQATGMNWEAYQRLDTIYEWMDILAANSSVGPLRVEVETFGYSFEKRPLKVLKISNMVAVSGKPRSAVWIDAGIHAREWIAPATATYIAREIIEANKRNEFWATSLDWHIVPVLNPDGYEYSQTTDRFWRKTRSYPRPEGSSILDTLINLCVGADPNRNWDYNWGGLGGSRNPCAPTYRGREQASEDEVKSAQAYILARNNTLKMYLTMHSYSQMVLLPWGHTYYYPDDYDDLITVADRAAQKLTAVHGTSYRRGTTPYLLYPAAGGSHDWAKGAAGIKYSYTIELPDRGFFGFLLPASRIIPTGQETLAFVRSMAEDITSLYYFGRTTATL